VTAGDKARPCPVGTRHRFNLTDPKGDLEGGQAREGKAPAWGAQGEGEPSALAPNPAFRKASPRWL
jgi:hypothetical protein